MDKKNDFYLMKILKVLRFPIVYTAHDLLPHDGNLQDYLEKYLEKFILYPERLLFILIIVKQI